MNPCPETSPERAQLFFKDFIFNDVSVYLCVSVWVCAWMCLQRPEEATRPLGAGTVVGYLTWGLRSEVGASVRAASVLNG